MLLQLDAPCARCRATHRPHVAEIETRPFRRVCRLCRWQLRGLGWFGLLGAAPGICRLTRNGWETVANRLGAPVGAGRGNR